MLAHPNLRGVHKRTNFTVAIKTLDKARIKEKGMTDKVMRETHILKLLSVEGHPHVVRLFEFIGRLPEPRNPKPVRISSVFFELIGRLLCSGTNRLYLCRSLGRLVS